ncbi:MAG TPA: hypothetical protein VLA72_15840 [Anaerolineales bacterium]|nr:hypothetical protein [Anaerolineales bacterium]
MIGKSVLILWLVVILWGLVFAWRKVPEYMPQSDIYIPAPIMNNEEYGHVINSHAHPYIYSVEAGSGRAVFVYGAEHTKDPKDPQIQDIKNQ